MPFFFQSSRFSSRPWQGVNLLWLVLATACGASSRQSIVPEENQQESKERYGEQQLMMEELNQTPGERASSSHHRATSPKRGPEREADGHDAK